jgi:hypothetical protein
LLVALKVIRDMLHRFQPAPLKRLQGGQVDFRNGAKSSRPSSSVGKAPQAA